MEASFSTTSDSLDARVSHVEDLLGSPTPSSNTVPEGTCSPRVAWRSDRITRCRWLKTATAISKSDAWRLHFGERGGRMHERDAPWREPWPRRRGFPLLSKSARRLTAPARRVFHALPAPVRQLLLRAPASPTGDPTPVPGPRSKLEADLPRLPVALMIDDYWPRPDSDAGSIEIVNLAKALLSFGFEVRFVADREHRAVLRPELGRDLLAAHGVRCLGTADTACRCVSGAGRLWDRAHHPEPRLVRREVHGSGPASLPRGTHYI